jgi:hypothetical protein
VTPVGAERRLVGCCGGWTRDDDSDRQEALRQKVESIAQDKAQIAAPTDATVVAALAAWRQCVQTAVGEAAATPNELARRYAFVDGTATDHEKQVAVADARCEQQVNLWTIYQTAVAHAERALMGADVTEYDELTRLRQHTIATARTMLAERGITPPSLG